MQDWTPTSTMRAKSLKDPLEVGGTFPQKERNLWSPCDKVVPFKRDDNLKMEGEFTAREGEFRSGKLDQMLSCQVLQRERKLWCPGDQVIPCNREDNLKMEGDFGQRERERLRNKEGTGGLLMGRGNLRQRENVEFDKGNLLRSANNANNGNDGSRQCTEKKDIKDREDIFKWKDKHSQGEERGGESKKGKQKEGDGEEGLREWQQDVRGRDNLKMEGSFSRRETAAWAPGEKAKSCRRQDNLNMEGEFCRREDLALRDEDLRTETGSFSSRKSQLSKEGRIDLGKVAAWDLGERVTKVVKPDNLSLR